MSTVILSIPLSSDMSREEIIDLMAKNNKEMNWLFGGKIDFKNIQVDGIVAKNIKAGAIETDKLAAGSVIADKIAAGAVETDKLAAGSVVTDKLAAGAVTAEKMTVDELSAITANMGTITAGSITTDAEIDVGTDARIGNILYLLETDASGTKGIVFSTVTGQSARINVLSGDMSITLSGFLTINPGSSMGVVVNGAVTADSFNAINGATGSFWVASSLGGPIDTEVTVTDGIIVDID